MSLVALWLTIIGMGLITFALRVSFVALLGRITISQFLRRALRFVPAAVLSALVFPAIVRYGGEPDLSFGNLRLLAGIIAATVAWRTKSVLWTIVIGMVALWLLQLVFS